MRELMKKYGWDVPFQPMNVKNAGDKADRLFADDNYVAELKRDGSRYVCIDGRFFSRKLSENKKQPEIYGLPVEKTANVPHLAEFFSRYENPGIIVDGEIYYPGKKSNDVTKIMGCDPEKALMRQGFGEFDFLRSDTGGMWRMRTRSMDWVKIDKETLAYINERGGIGGLEPIHYMIFDILHLFGMPLFEYPWEERRQMLENWYEREVVGTEYEAYITISVPFEGENAKRALLKWAEENREEGIVFKNRKSFYVPGKRPENHWYRIKGKIFADVVVMGFEPPEREYTGKELDRWPYWENADGCIMAEPQAMGGCQKLIELGYTPVTKFHFYGLIGSIKFGLYKDGKLVEAGTCSGMDDKTRELLSNNQESYIGKVIEISAMERTPKGLFRHPQFERFRDDKNATDCLWETEVEDGNG